MPTWSKAPATPFEVVPERIPLEPDPLVRVVAQVRFAPVLSVREQGFIAPFQEEIRGSYPLAQKEIQQEVALGAQGVLQVAESVLWRFSDASRAWEVSLSENFVSLACSNYSDRVDFLGRLRKALDAVGHHIRPVLTRRVGVRYVNRLSGVEMTGRLPLFIRSELLGLASAELGNGEVLSELTEAAFVTDAVNLRGRWGHLPANAAYEATIDPIDKPSWLLDLDAYTAATTPFDAQLCAEEAERYTAIVHGFFRWAVSDQFLEAHEATI